MLSLQLYYSLKGAQFSSNYCTISVGSPPPPFQALCVNCSAVSVRLTVENGTFQYLIN